MPRRILDSVKLRRFAAWLLNSVALVGMVLASLGLYATLAYLVQLRRREIAIRMTFGATAGDIARLVARQSLSLSIAGLGPGAILSFVAARATRSFHFGVAPLDPWTIAGTVGGLVLLVAVATWSPLAQASGMNPLHMLREE
jgi:ABC-type antimicrobial peptide transport system permease subunit